MFTAAMAGDGPSSPGVSVGEVKKPTQKLGVNKVGTGSLWGPGGPDLIKGELRVILSVVQCRTRMGWDLGHEAASQGIAYE